MIINRWILAHPSVYAYRRSYANDELLVVNNLSSETTNFAIPEQFLTSNVIIAKYDDVTIQSSYMLRPYEAFALLKAEVS